MMPRGCRMNTRSSWKAYRRRTKPGRKMLSWQTQVRSLDYAVLDAFFQSNVLIVLPDDLLKEAVPGNIRKAEHFVAFLKRLVEYLKTRMRVLHVVAETPLSFLQHLKDITFIERRPLRYETTITSANPVLPCCLDAENSDFAPSACNHLFGLWNLRIWMNMLLFRRSQTLLLW